MSYPTVARVLAVVLVLCLVGSAVPAFARSQASPQPGSWLEKAPDWLVTLLLKDQPGNKPRPRRPGPPTPNPGGGEEGPGTCPSGITESDSWYHGPGHC